MSKNVTGTNLYEYFSCWKKLANKSLSKKEQKKIKGKMHAFVLHQMEEGKKHEKKVLEKILETDDVTTIPRASAKLKSKLTIKAMERGDKIIYQGGLLDEQNNLYGEPDLMMRVNGVKSKFGNYAYVSIDVKNSLNPKGEQIIQVVHYSKILKKVQGKRPPNAYIFNKSRDKDKVYEENAFKVTRLKKGKKNSPFKLLSERFNRAKQKKLAQGKIVRNINKEIKSFKASFQNQERTPEYYVQRRVLKKQLIKEETKLKVLKHEFEPFYNQMNMIDKSAELMDEYSSILETVIAIKNRDEVPTPTISTSTCNHCEYKKSCYDEAIKTNDISLVFGIGSTKKRSFMDLGIHKISDLLKVEDHESLIVEGEITENLIKKVMTGALGWKTGKLLTYKNNRMITNHGGKPLIKPNLREPHTAVQFDFEAHEETGNMIMNGFNIREQGKPVRARTCFVDNPKDEIKIIEDFFDFLKKSNDDIQLYHWHSYERTAINKMLNKYYPALQKKYGDEYFDLEDKLLDNLVDLLPIATKSFAAPIHSYSIKVFLPKIFNFHWRNEEMDGAAFEVVYQNFLDSSDEDERAGYLKTLIEYNQDDVLGPWHVYDKLLELSK